MNEDMKVVRYTETVPQVWKLYYENEGRQRHYDIKVSRWNQMKIQQKVIHEAYVLIFLKDTWFNAYCPIRNTIRSNVRAVRERSKSIDENAIRSSKVNPTLNILPQLLIHIKKKKKEDVKITVAKETANNEETLGFVQNLMALSEPITDKKGNISIRQSKGKGDDVTIVDNDPSIPTSCSVKV